MVNVRLTDKIRGYMHEGGLEVRSMTEISESAVAVLDGTDEIDIYFEAAHYNVIHPEVWGENSEFLFPETLIARGLGVLQGKSKVPEPTNMLEALAYARMALEPRSKSAKWYSAPKDIL